MSADMVLAYLDFVVERHRIWELRQAGAAQPWTEDPILAGKKFTNVFRVLDHGSQFLLTMLNELGSQREILARAFLYRHTGRPEPWEFFELMHGRYPLVADLPLALETWRTYQGKISLHTRADTGRVMNIKQRSLFTGAYLVFPQSQVPGTDKLDSIIALTARLFTEGSPDDVVPGFLASSTQQRRFRCLQKNPGVGDFMSMQILTDYGYTTEDRENELVVAGPGAIKGAKVLFPSRKPLDVIHWARDQLLILNEFDGVPTQLYGRDPSLMDVQNTLCEFSKYARYMGQPVQKYKPAHPGAQPKPTLPTHW